MKRRELFKAAGILSAQSIFVSTGLQSVFATSAFGAQVPIDSLRGELAPDEAQILVPTDPKFAAAQVAFNKRVLRTPLLRVQCASPKAVAITIQWARQNQIPLALRSGGHSYEGFSQSTGLVIDTRPMNQISLQNSDNTIGMGAGVSLGNAYKVTSSKGRAVPAGSCPTVGVTGHTSGGGYGLLARPLGLACDSLEQAQVVDAEGKILSVSANENSDLFWALRGGGGGSFGVITELEFRTHSVPKLIVFGQGWKLKSSIAASMMQAWLKDAPEFPKEITSLLKVSKDSTGLINVRVVGQTMGSSEQLHQALAPFREIAKPDSSSESDLSFIQAVSHFAGAGTGYPSTYMKGKSDYITQVPDLKQLAEFLANLPAGQLAALFDCYGGAIREVAVDATAFAHREALCSIQYYSEWASPTASVGRIESMRKFYDSVRGMMSGQSYVNYCDLDLKNYAQAYWGPNLDRLMKIKTQVDPTNFFRHAQSMPVLKS